MKNQIRAHIERNLKRKGASADHGEFASVLDHLTEEAEKEYDRLSASGKTDLESYRGAMEKIADESKRASVFLRPSEDAEGGEENAGAKKEGSDTLSAIEQTAHSVLWLLTIAAYLTVSLIFGHWEVTWLMFLSAAAGSIIIDIVFNMNRGHSLLDEWDNMVGVLWIVIVAVYFLVSFFTGKWAITWLIFIGGVILSVILDTVKSTLVKAAKKEDAENGGGENDE